MAITFDGELVEIERPHNVCETADIEDTSIIDLGVVQLPTTTEVPKELDAPTVRHVEPEFEEVIDVEEFIDKFYAADNEVQLEIMAKHVVDRYIDPEKIHVARQLYVLQSILFLPKTLALVKKIVILKYTCSPKFIDFTSTGVSVDDISLIGLIVMGVDVENKATGKVEHLGIRFTGSFGEYVDGILTALSRKIEVEGNLTI
jgi:hypothetical protein